MFGLRHKDAHSSDKPGKDSQTARSDHQLARAPTPPQPKPPRAASAAPSAPAGTPGAASTPDDGRDGQRTGPPTLQVIIASDGRHETRMYPLKNARTTIGSDPANDIVIAAAPMPRFYVAFRRLRPQGPYLVESLGSNVLTVRGGTVREHTLAPGDALRLEGQDGDAVTLVYVPPASGPSREGHRHQLPATPLAGQTVTIGRAQDNQIVVEQPLVAEHHARLEHQGGGQYAIHDLDTVSGTYVHGVAVEEAPLRPGDQIRIGRAAFVFTGDALLHAPARVQREVAGVRVEARGLREQVRAGGILGLGHKVLLDDVSLTIPSGAFVALVGGSGAGKTTLLNALSGQRPADEGTVLFNGVNLYEHLGEFGAVMGYVPQDDIIHLNIVVERALYYAARLRLPSLSRRQVWERVEEVLRDVDLMPQRKQLIAHLSGGQRKRVNIAVELLARPPVFFLDEPTSGLDPGLDRKIMQLLRRLADRGHTIVLATHVTGNIAACDFVCFIAPGGRLAYYGPPDQLRTHFQMDEIASVYTALDNDPAGWAERYKSSREYREYVERPAAETQKAEQQAQDQQPSTAIADPAGQSVAPATATATAASAAPPGVSLVGSGAAGSAPPAPPPAAAPSAQSAQPAKPAERAQQTKDEQHVLAGVTLEARPSPWLEFSVLTRRYTRLFVRDTVNLVILLAQAPIIAALVVILADKNVLHNAFIGVHPPPDLYAQRALFIVVTSGVWFGIINAARELVKERSIYLRERAVYLGIIPYVLSKVVVLGVLCAIQSFVLLYIVGMRIGYPTHGLIWPGLRGAFVEMYIALWLVSLSGLALGLCISALAPNSDRAISFVPIALVPQIIFASVTFDLSGTASKLISWVVATRWGIEALGSIGHLHDKLTGQTFAFYHWDAGHLIQYWAALTGLTLGFLALTLFFLRLQDHRRHRL